MRRWTPSEKRQGLGKNGDREVCPRLPLRPLQRIPNYLSSPRTPCCPFLEPCHSPLYQLSCGKWGQPGAASSQVPSSIWALQKSGQTASFLLTRV